MTQKLRIFTACHYPDRGGTEMYVCRLARGLERRGHTVVVGCRPDSWVEDLARQMGLPVTNVLPRGPGDFVGILRCAAMLRRGKFDVVHAHTGRMYAPLIVAARLSKSKVVITYHLTCGRSLFTSLAMRLADAIVAVSGAVKNVMIKQCRLPECKVTTLLTGIDLSAFYPLAGDRSAVVRLGLPGGAPIFGAVNRLDPDKRSDTFLRAAALVKAVHPEARYVVLGEGSEREALEKLRSELQLDAEFLLPGFVDNVPEILRCFDAFVLCSENEPFALANLEAMASGVPVLASSAGGNAESMTPNETGLLFPVGDVHALAEHMIWVLGHPDQARAMGAAGRKRAVTCFDEERMIDDWESLLSQVVVGDRGRDLK